jgi:hypothetical protein
MEDFTQVFETNWMNTTKSNLILSIIWPCTHPLLGFEPSKTRSRSRAKDGAGSQLAALSDPYVEVSGSVNLH